MESHSIQDQRQDTASEDPLVLLADLIADLKSNLSRFVEVEVTVFRARLSLAVALSVALILLSLTGAATILALVLLSLDGLSLLAQQHLGWSIGFSRFLVGLLPLLILFLGIAIYAQRMRKALALAVKRRFGPVQ